MVSADNGSVSVANNAVTSAVAGNRVLNNVQGAAFSSATGTLDYSATQTLNGNAAAAAVGKEPFDCLWISHWKEASPF